uniref:ABC transporter domain-containing protein n=1 Tax=Fusarium oxysporum (strain Fo5176) TaxID=660025 RepID=A0A0D2Y6P3_FUSOF
MPPPNCLLHVEDTFGPVVKGCGSNFDFTLLFEETILCILPLCVAICLAVFRITRLWKKPVIFKGCFILPLKLIAWTLVLGSQTSTVALFSIRDETRTRASIAAGSIGILGSAILACLSFLEHQRAVRTSSILVLYLLSTIPMDAARTRTLWRMLDGRDPAIAVMVLASTKVCALVTEVLWKCSLRNQAPIKLAKEIFFSHIIEFLAPIFPRLCYLALTFAQPFLVRRAIDYISKPKTDGSKERGDGLIAAYALVYYGIAFVSSLYEQSAVRATTVVRADLSMRIYQQSLLLDRVVDTGDSSSLLLGGYWSGRASRFQKNWMAAIEKRLHKTVQVLKGIKSIKQMGAAPAIKAMLEYERQSEIKLSKRFRLQLIALVTLSFQVMTLFNIVSSSIQDCTSHVMAIMVGLGSLQRIESFLNQHTWTDPRKSIRDASISTDESSVGGTSEKKVLTDVAVKIQNVSAKWTEDGEAVIKDATFDVPAHGLTVIAGPTGSGKSTLLRVVLGDLAPSSGTVSVDDSQVAFCDQTPWIANIIIKENIVGALPFYEERYRMALHACALDQDIEDLTDGDKHLCGLNGQSVSGGQKVRIALARAIYSKATLVLLDDCLVGLDTNTERHILGEIFAPRGLLSSAPTTTILATSSHRAFTAREPRAQDSDELPNTAITNDIAFKKGANGDWAVYKWYFGVIGWMDFIVFLFLCLLFVIGVIFPHGQWSHVKQDLQITDMELPLAFVGATMNLLMLIAQCIVVTIQSHYAGFAILAIAIVIGFFHEFYLRTSRRLRVMDIEARSPVLSLLLESLDGLATSAQVTLNLSVDLFVATLALVVISIAVVQMNTSGGSLGLALFNIVGLGQSVKGVVFFWTSLEITLGAVARIRDFTQDTHSEHESDTKPPAEWPSRGEIHFSDVTLTHSTSLPPTISNLTLDIKPGSKMAICGRTGSGKSTLVNSLLGLVQVSSGLISIDDVDISTLAKDEVRSRFVVLPQESLILSVSIREYAKLFGISDEQEIIQGLKKTGLWQTIEQGGGLDMIASSDTFSHGERQLFAMTLACLKKGKIVLMDEPTSQ